MSHDLIRRQITDIRDTLDAIETRAARAATASRTPASRRNQLGTNVTGNSVHDYDPDDPNPSGRTWSDRTGDTAVEIVDVLRQVATSLSDVKQASYTIAASLNEWAPARQWDNIRRCTINDCAIKHYARGYCKKHYDRAVRAEQREGTRGVT